MMLLCHDPFSFSRFSMYGTGTGTVLYLESSSRQYVLRTVSTILYLRKILSRYTVQHGTRTVRVHVCVCASCFPISFIRYLPVKNRFVPLRNDTQFVPLHSSEFNFSCAISLEFVASDSIRLGRGCHMFFCQLDLHL